MPPFKSQEGGFNKEDDQFKKIGSLEKEEETSKYLVESRKERRDEVDALYDQIRKIEREIKNIKESQDKEERYVRESTLFKTNEGANVASLPETHPVMREITKQEKIESLKQGVINILEALRLEEENREPVDWNKNGILDSLDIDPTVKELITSDQGEIINRDDQSKEYIEKGRKYVTELFPELFKDKNDIYRIDYCNEYEFERGSGFSGVAVFSGRDLYLIEKNGKRFCLKKTLSNRTYPKITKNGPDFAGYGKTSLGRFIFSVEGFDSIDSSAGYKPSNKNREETDEEAWMRIGNTLGYIDGIDPNTYYDKETKCITIGDPVFLED